ncbi:MAG: nuclear transport factor 2 family protein [Gemmatimonadetes bacterium]|nr:MAG: nuclear transport factor 2 family protein [Gemmatimonadota bacterium]
MTTTTATTTDLRERVEDLNRMILEGRAMEAFEKYYADDVVMWEDAENPCRGKEANRKREEEFFAKVTEFRGAEVKAVALGEDVSMVEWHFDYTHADWGDMNYDQVAVQRWRDGRIVDERFYKLG